MSGQQTRTAPQVGDSAQLSGGSDKADTVTIYIGTTPEIQFWGPEAYADWVECKRLHDPSTAPPQLSERPQVLVEREFLELWNRYLVYQLQTELEEGPM